ncbi:MAG TPA: DUF2630 family protein [Acidimicrobiales bacterium]|jgi:hypothetical protein
MDDQEIIETIDRLVAEEHSLRENRPGEAQSESDAARLQALEVSLDQCWDLLRQRRARRQYGEDSDEATVRDPSVVEHYRQ